MYINVVIIVCVFGNNEHIKVVIIIDLGQRHESAWNAEDVAGLPGIWQVPSLCCLS